jgi:aminoglycoside phosphotransferase (APT) family kinase protein
MREITLKDLGRFADLIPIEKLEKIERGWSEDVKYIITCPKGKYLLRVTDIRLLSKKAKEISVIELVGTLNINTPKFIEMQTLEDMVLMVLTFIEGEDAIKVIPTLPTATQYRLGYASGKILWSIHHLTHNLVQESDFLKTKNKILDRLAKYEKSAYMSEEDRLPLKYVYENIDVLKDMNVRLNHGDFHIGNMIINDQLNLGIIDFNRFDYEDYIKEFVAILTFSKAASIPFTRGQLNGYFQDGIPKLFWKKVKVYLAYNAMYSVLWAEQYGESEIQYMLSRKEIIYFEYDYFRKEKPDWVKG